LGLDSVFPSTFVDNYLCKLQFGTMARNAERAGAQAVIIVQQEGGKPSTGLDASEVDAISYIGDELDRDGLSVTIPVYMVKRAAGLRLKDAINNNANTKITIMRASIF
jgi:hypothetical protein